MRCLSAQRVGRSCATNTRASAWNLMLSRGNAALDFRPPRTAPPFPHHAVSLVAQGFGLGQGRLAPPSRPSDHNKPSRRNPTLAGGNGYASAANRSSTARFEGVLRRLGLEGIGVFQLWSFCPALLLPRTRG